MRLRAYRPILLFLVVLCCGGISQAQDPETGLYRSFFGEDTTVWNYCELEGDCGYIHNMIYTFVNDTVINDTTYKKVFIQNGDYPPTPRIPYGYAKEDRRFGSLWLRDTVGIMRKIVDLSLDTVENNDLEIRYDSLGRKIIQLNHKPYIYYEEIGIIGNDFRLPGRWTDSQVICVWHDNNHLYKKEDTWWGFSTDCRWFTTHGGSIHTTTEFHPRIYPNPCNDWLNVGYDGVCEVTVTDLYGRVAMSEVVDDGRLDVSGLKKGCYTVRIEANGKSYVKKIVKI